MPRRSRLASSRGLSPAARNARADRIACAADGAAAVFRAALSASGLRALCRSASVLSGSVGESWKPPEPLSFSPDAGPTYTSALRLYALAVSFSVMRDARARFSDLRWTLGTSRFGSTVLRDVPLLSTGSGVARTASDIVLRVLRATPAPDGLRALTVLVEDAGLLEAVRPNTHPQPLLPYSLVAPATSAVVVPPPSPQPPLPLASLPTLGVSPVDGPVLPAPLYALMSARTERRGGGHSADLALRIFVEAVTAVMQRDWETASYQPVRISVTLREFLNWFYGSYDRWPSRDRYWRRFVDAADALVSRRARFPFEVDGYSGSLSVVTLPVIPRGPNRLDDAVTMLVQLPPGSAGGPAIDRLQLRDWGLRSEVAYRVLIALAYHWHRPGRTLICGPDGRWIRSTDPAVYEPFTDDGLISLCYPTSRMRKRSVLLRRARGWMRVLHAAGVLRFHRDQRVLPPAP